MYTIYNESNVMDGLLSGAQPVELPKPGTLVDGTVVSIYKNSVLVDLNGVATGIISGHEAYDAAGTAKTLATGDAVQAYVLESENDDGLVVLSLRKASQKKIWNDFIEAFEKGKVIKVVPNEANKGGLLLNIDGIKGFIPVSQLAPLHYPRVNGADASQILTRLQKLIGMELSVKIINLDREGGKLILSERAAESEKRQDALNTLLVNQKIKGKISGIVNFGIFVTFDGLEGLVHISEIAWGHVKDPNDFGKLGDMVEVLVIGKDKDKISLSMKRLVPDPWLEAAKKYQVGKIIKGEINRITPFGAFVKLDDDINGLIHVSEISGPEGGFKLNVGETVEAKIIAIEPEEHRVGLSIKALTETPADTATEAPKKSKKKAEEKAEDEADKE